MSGILAKTINSEDEITPRFLGHNWRKRDEEDGGGTDFLAMYGDGHNGPVCENCGYSFCVHCAINYRQPVRPCSKVIVISERAPGPARDMDPELSALLRENVRSEDVDELVREKRFS